MRNPPANDPSRGPVQAPPKTTGANEPSGRIARAPSAGPPIRLVSWTEPSEEKPAEAKEEKKEEQVEAAATSPSDTKPAAPAAAPQPNETPARAGSEQSAAAGDAKRADIKVTVTPGGIVISSDDVEALNEYEKLLRSVMGTAGGGPPGLGYGRTIAIFYLRYATADEAAQLLSDILGGTSSGGGGGGSLIGDVASGLVGGGGLLGAVLGGGEGGAGAVTIGSVSVVPDPRLNRLIAQGTAAELDSIEQLLKVIDQESSITDIETRGTPHVIPVQFVPVEEVAQVVREAFSDRIAVNRSGGASGQRGPSPEDLIRALASRGRGGRGGNSRGTDSRAAEPTMTIAVDARNRSLIVTAPEPLYLQVRDLVESIDQMAAQTTDDISVVTLEGGTNADLVQRALSSILGASQSGSRSGGGQSRSGSSGGGPSGGFSPQGGGASPADIQQRMEMFRRMRESGGGGGGGGGFGGGRPTGATGSSRSGSSGGSPFGGGSGQGGFSRGGQRRRVRRRWFERRPALRRSSAEAVRAAAGQLAAGAVAAAAEDLGCRRRVATEGTSLSSSGCSSVRRPATTLFARIGPVHSVVLAGSPRLGLGKVSRPCRRRGGTLGCGEGLTD